MWPSATPATQSAAASSATKTGPGAPPSAMSATPATQNEGGCEPRLPRKVVDQDGVWKVVVDKAVSSATKTGPSAPPSPRLPRKTKVNVRLCHACHVKRTVDVTKCHACHAKCRGHPQLKRAQARHPVPWVPRLPRKTKVKRLCHACHVKRPVDVTKCHACHAKCRGVIRD